tara:strand:- start:51266 stop:52621 length:1356 start_codon:yes stop_codon:yes gene_type:complete
MKSLPGPKIDTVICSAGGVATTLLLRHFNKLGVMTNDPMDRDRLKHSKYPPKDDNIKRGIYIYGDPQEAYKSLVRRKFLDRQIKKTAGSWAHEEDPLGLEGHFESWLSHSNKYPIMFIKYDDIWNKIHHINEFIEFSDHNDLPEKRPRRSDAVLLPKLNNGKELYEDYAKRIQKLPSIFIKKPDKIGMPTRLLGNKSMKIALVGLMRGFNDYSRYEKKLLKRNRLLHENFNKIFNYPMLIFNEGTILPEHQKAMHEQCPNLIFIDIKKWWNENASTGGGYKRMCLFNCSFLQKYLHEHGYHYYLRLDDDVFMHQAPNPVHLFAWMRENDIDYVYSRRKIDSHRKTQVTLSKFCIDYFKKDIKPHFNYYNNFHASNTKFWAQPKVQDFIEACKGGIASNRWGDSSVQSAAIRGFDAKSKCIELNYGHGSHGYTSYTRKGEYNPRHEWDPQNL